MRTLPRLFSARLTESWLSLLMVLHGIALGWVIPTFADDHCYYNLVPHETVYLIVFVVLGLGWLLGTVVANEGKTRWLLLLQAVGWAQLALCFVDFERVLSLLVYLTLAVITYKNYARVSEASRYFKEKSRARLD